MGVELRERKKRDGVCYAFAPDGIELPVIDVTHPAFGLEVSEEVMEGKIAEFVRDAERRARVPRVLQRILLKVMLRRSVLGKALMGAQGGYLSGLATYMAKLGPENLGEAYAAAVDRKIAGSLPCLCNRLRLGDMARLLGEGLAPVLGARPGGRVHLVNIGGGVAADSLNALIVMRKEQAGVLEGRRVSIDVLDVDDAGPAFGAAALEALLAEGAPLHGLDVRFAYVRYDWSEVAPLRRVLGGIEGEDIVAASSEGGLFEYGSDEVIGANLEAYREASPTDAIMVGSVTRADSPARQVGASTQIAIRPRSMPDFAALVRRAGWGVDRVVDRPFSHHVVLKKA